MKSIMFKKKSLIFIILLTFGLVGCGSDAKEDTNSTEVIEEIGDNITSSVGDTNNTEVIQEVDDVISSSTEEKIYYGIKMYEEPDSSFTHSLTTGLYSIYTKTDDSYWSKISAITIENQGIVKLILKKTFYNDEYGISANSSFNDLKASLDEKYTNDDNFDFCTGSSYICQSDNYSYSLYKNERFKSNWYHNEDDLIVLELNGNAESLYNIDLEILYETKEFADFKDKETENIADDL